LSLFPNKDNILTGEIESWKGFEDALRTQEDRVLFKRMLNDCYKYSTAINAKGELFPTEAVLMSLILQQQKMIDWLIVQISFGLKDQIIIIVGVVRRRKKVSSSSNYL
jgi:hypothetical protein